MFLSTKYTSQFRADALVPVSRLDSLRMDNLSQGVDRWVHLLLQPIPLALSRPSFLLQQKQAERKAETPSMEQSNTPHLCKAPPTPSNTSAAQQRPGELVGQVARKETQGEKQ